METDFAEWLLGELDLRGWNQAELAKRGRITTAQMSRVLNGTRGYGIEFLRGVARALNIPVEVVLRKCGWLPAVGVLPDGWYEMGERVMALSPEQRDRVLQVLENTLSLVEGRPAQPRRQR